jgi:hypothetical protein
MKFSAFILSCIILALSCLPCRDGIVARLEKGKIEFAKSTNSQQDTHKSDACSPFCSCSCCTGTNFSFTLVTVDNIIFHNAKHAAALIPSSLREIALPIWQPPQLSA